jgi:hypothetical protein
MAVPYEHIKYTTDLSKEHFEELKNVHEFTRKFF